MRFDEELVGRSLHPISNRHTAYFAGEPLLRFPSAQMFNNAVGKNNVEFAIAEWQTRPVSHDRGAPIAHRSHHFNRVNIERGNARFGVRTRPETRVSTHVENPRLLVRLQ